MNYILRNSFRNCSCRIIKNNYSKQNDSSIQVGFIGIGQMGSHMVLNLLKKGQSVIVYDMYRPAAEKMVAHGAVVANSCLEVAKNSNFIITMLPDGKDVMQVYTSDDGILRGVRAEVLLIDSSTINPEVSKNLANLAEKESAFFMDAPVSGGIIGAKNGTLTFMIGGSEHHVQKINHILSLMGKNIKHCGDVGTGQIAKLCNNMILGISMAGVAEAMNLGIR